MFGIFSLVGFKRIVNKVTTILLFFCTSTRAGQYVFLAQGIYAAPPVLKIKKKY